MQIHEITTPAEAREYLVALVGDKTRREIDRLVGYSGWSAYKKGKCEIAAGTWFRIYAALDRMEKGDI